MTGDELDRLAAQKAAHHRERGEAVNEVAELMLEDLGTFAAVLSEAHETGGDVEKIVAREPRLSASADETLSQFLARVREMARAAAWTRPAVYRAIVRNEFEVWPFTVDGGVLSGHADGSIVFWTPDGVAYEINGHAQAELGFKLPNSAPIRKEGTLGWVNALGSELVKQAMEREA